MTTNNIPQRKFIFGPFCLDLTERVLSRGGRTVPLAPKIVDTLILLVENAGRVVGKYEMIERLWGDTFVEESSLSQNIFLLRKALGDGSRGREFIETLPKRGYRFATEPGRVANDYRTSVVIRGQAIKRIRSLAVMPFAVINGKTGENKGLGLSMTDAIIGKLSGLRGMSVIPTRTIIKYTERVGDLRTVVREQGVDAMVEGSVQRSGEKVRVRAQLILTDGQCVWSGEIEEQVEDLFLIQDLISKRIEDELTSELKGRIKPDNGGRGTGSRLAYEACLMGFYFANRKTTEALNTSIEYFEKSVEFDPLFARPHAGAADSLFWLAHGSSDRGFREGSFEKSRANALRAIALDDTLAEGHAALGTVLVKHDRDAEGADRAFRKAVEIDSNSAMAFSRYAYFLVAMGRIDEALTMVERCLEIDPLSPDSNAGLAMVLHFCGRHDEAIHYCETALAIEPGYTDARLLLGRCFEQKGMSNEAEIAYKAGAEMSPSCSEGRELLTHLYAATDRADLARSELSTLLSPPANGHVRAYNIAATFAMLGDDVAAVEWLEKPDMNWTERLRWLRYDPRLYALRFPRPERPIARRCER